MSSNAAARCTGLVKRFGEVLAVNGLDLEVCKGECFGLLGPNGAGKTTTIEILEGLTEPSGGTVEVLGEHWGQGRDRVIRQRLGIQLQDTKLSEKLSVEETVRLFRSFFDDGYTVSETIAKVSLEEKRKDRVGNLSGGQRQRLAVACALVNKPDLLFLDEPTTGLDPQARLNLWEVIEDFRAGGGTVLLTTHYMEEAARLCDRVAIIDHGKVIALDTPDALIASLGAHQIIEFNVQGQLETEPLRGLDGVRDVSQHDGSFMLSVEPIAAALPALLRELERQQVELRDLATHNATLEDVFVRLTGRALRDA